MTCSGSFIKSWQTQLALKLIECRTKTTMTIDDGYLRYDSQLWAKVVEADQRNVNAVYDNLTGRRFNDTKQSQCERRLAGTGTTNDSNLTTT